MAALPERPPETQPTRPIRVWDLPTRVFHWLLALAVFGAFGCAWSGLMEWHVRCGITALALLAFRLVWGFAGGRWSRFSSFLYSPATLKHWWCGEVGADERLDVGHSPLGALSVFALLALLAVQVATGLFSDDEVATAGPLAHSVSDAVVERAGAWHAGPGKLLVLLLVVAHVVAIVVYARRGKRLLPPMWHGDKPLPAGTPASADGVAQRLLALVLALAAFAFAGWVFSLGQ